MGWIEGNYGGRLYVANCSDGAHVTVDDAGSPRTICLAPGAARQAAGELLECAGRPAPEGSVRTRVKAAHDFLAEVGISVDLRRGFTLEQIEALAEVVKNWED
jgi:hypothetical protein